MADPFVIVGGDAAGLSAASKCKRDDPDREVIVFEKSDWISYSHCGMPYYVKGEVDQLGNLLSLTPDDVQERGIDLHRHHEVLAVDPAQEIVQVQGPDGEFEQPYGDLLIATGARARTSPIDGTDLENVFTMHHMTTAAKLRALLMDPSDGDDEPFETPYVDVDVSEYLERDPPETAAIIGGGPVGVEMAEAFRGHDLETHLFHRGDLPLGPYGDAVGERARDALEANDVELHLDTAINSLEGNGSVTCVDADDGPLDVDLAIVGVGITPNTELLADTRVEQGDSGAILIDEHGRTSIENIYAAGDCAAKAHTVTGGSAWVPLGLTANRAGRAVGATVAGNPEPVGEIAGTAVIKAFDLECGRTGLVDPEDAREHGFDPVVETVTAGSRSGYYPGGDETTVTLVADRESGRLLGGTVAGEDRAAIRINHIATALEAGLTIEEFERLDLAYAPPFSPVWDPTLVGAKVLRGSIEE